MPALLDLNRGHANIAGMARSYRLYLLAVDCFEAVLRAVLAHIARFE
jgi:hypothetical protein